MKIQIIGYSGSGKSTLAKELADLYKIPVLHLDNVHFYGNWQERTKEEQEEIINDFMAENKSWVIDGNYTSLAPERFKEADVSIYLDYNRLYCYKMAKKRYKTFKGQKRDDCDSPEKFDFEFKKWILHDGRTKNKKNRMLGCVKLTEGDYYVFKNVRQKNKFLEGLKNNYKKVNM